MASRSERLAIKPTRKKVHVSQPESNAQFWPDELSDPGLWSTERLERHGRLWCGLPSMPGITESMDDDDVEVHGEMLYISGLIDALAVEKAALVEQAQLPDGRYASEPLMWLMFLKHSAEAFPHWSYRLEPSWDEAIAPLVAVGVEIAAWRGDEAAAA